MFSSLRLIQTNQFFCDRKKHSASSPIPFVAVVPPNSPSDASEFSLGATSRGPSSSFSDMLTSSIYGEEYATPPSKRCQRWRDSEVLFVFLLRWHLGRRK
ncbi:unnamed protein product [Cuscuta epithymum]|uniref:Uncharacterized protein n=1 Tax=Cuscuta epithymum TaxID=186058 RepID=A0AAV0GJQ5_9ASTE|nr:unnamed protein product [Cuscuta epithymum]